jgi:hypothetical protein
MLLKDISAGREIGSRRIFGWNCDKVMKELRHFLLLAAQPVQKRIGPIGSAAQGIRHRVRQ